MERNSKKSVLFRLLDYVKPYWYLILMSTVFGVAKMTLPLVMPRVLQYFTDELLPSGLSVEQKSAEVIKWMLILLAIYLFAYMPSAYLRQMGATEVSNRLMHTLRCQVYGHMQKMSAAFHQENRSGNLVTRVSNDIEMVHNFVWNVATNVWIDSLVLVVYLWQMFSMSVSLTVITMITLPLIIIMTKKIRERIRKADRRVLENISEISGYMQERMAGYATVKLFNREDYETEKFGEISKTIYRYNLEVNRMFSLGEAFTGSSSEIVFSFVLCLAILNIIHGKMTIGDMILYNTCLSSCMTPLRRFAELNVTYAKSLAGIERIFEILDMPLDIVEKPDAVTFNEEIPMDIVFDHVSFRYDQTKSEDILSDIHFEVKEGENIALVGSSGCGKSTIVNLLARFYDVEEGRILIGGRDIRDYELDSLYRQIGMVFQDTVLFSESIEDNISYGKEGAAFDEIVAAAKAANAYEFILNTPDGFHTKLGERGIGLSGGQKQRIAIARVFLKNPRLLILDEATSALDSESEELVQDALDHLMEKRTSIVIAHRLSTIINADRILVMDQGRIIETGKHEELLKKGGRYAQLYRMQFKDVIEEQSAADAV